MGNYTQTLTQPSLPILADEAAVNAQAIPKLADAYDGINIKLDKCGGIQQALRMIYVAKSLGMKTMLGCMISSSISITAAAHLSPLVDYADLDGNLLIANDAFHGVTVSYGKLILPDGPGLGLTPAIITPHYSSRVIYNIDCSDSNIAFDSRNKIGNHHLDSGSRRRTLVSAAPATSTVLDRSPPQSEI